MTTVPSQRFWRVPLDADQMTRTRGSVSVLEERCKGCSYCVEFCPRSVLAISSRFNMKGYHPPDVVKPDACTGCHLCEIICPDFAISVEEMTYTEKTAGMEGENAG